MEKLEIYSSKKQSLWMLVTSMIFVAFGLWLLLDTGNMTGWKAKIPFLTQGISVASILFFGLGFFIAVKRLIKPEVILSISSEGLNINPRKSSAYFLKWAEITGFEEITIQKSRILIIGVKNPDYWLNKEKSGFRRKLMRYNIRNYNSPFNISAAGLDITPDRLAETLLNYYEKYQTED